MTDFWERIKAKLKARGMTQKGLSVMIGEQERAVETWIARDVIPDAEQAYKIARALNTTVEHLVTGKTDDRLAALRQKVREMSELLG